MGKHRSTAEILLSRPVVRLQVKHQDGPSFPAPHAGRARNDPCGILGQHPGQTDAAQDQARPRPRLLDPVLSPANFGDKASEDKATTTRWIIRRRSVLNREGAASGFGGVFVFGWRILGMGPLPLGRQGWASVWEEGGVARVALWNGVVMG